MRRLPALQVLPSCFFLCEAQCWRDLGNKKVTIRGPQTLQAITEMVCVGLLRFRGATWLLKTVQPQLVCAMVAEGYERKSRLKDCFTKAVR